jgi:AbrB family looped-hinge helix DNA binding protein
LGLCFTYLGRKSRLDFIGQESYPWSMKSTVSAKGQVTIPVEVRERLGLETGTIVLFDLREDGALLRKGSHGEHPVDKVFGVLGVRRPVDSLRLLDEMRGPRPGGPRSRPRGRRS